MKAIWLVLFLPSLANAEPVQLAVSEPFVYASGSFGATASFGVTDHQAVRLNVARYGGEILDAVAIIAAGSETPSRHGKTTDYAVGWVYHPHALGTASSSVSTRCFAAARRPRTTATSASI